MSDILHDDEHQIISRGISNTVRNFESRVDSLVAKQLMDNNVDTLIPTKLCNVCGRTLPFTEFHKNRTKVDGVQSECKDCKRKFSREYNKMRCEKLEREMKLVPGNIHSVESDVTLNHRVLPPSHETISVTGLVNNALSDVLAKRLHSTPEEVTEAALKHYMGHLFKNGTL